MDIKYFRQQLTRQKSELDHYFQRKLPVKAGAKAKSIIQENFRLGDFQNGNLTKWAVTKRQISGGERTPGEDHYYQVVKSFTQAQLISRVMHLLQSLTMSLTRVFTTKEVPPARA